MTLWQVPLLCVIVHNASMTVDNMRGFSAIFSSQAGALQTERRKTEDLLTEMLPRSVAKQLRAGKTVQAEEYEVGPCNWTVTVTAYWPYENTEVTKCNVYRASQSEAVETCN